MVVAVKAGNAKAAELLLVLKSLEPENRERASGIRFFEPGIH